MKSNAINVIYIVSSSHSGSTLLDLMLGSHSAIHSGGEFFRLPQTLNIDQAILPRCSCGEKVIHCAFWKEVTEEAKINFNTIFSSSDFFSLYYQIIPAILKVSGKTHFVDSSKHIHLLKKYLSTNDYHVSIIHLIRDPRAVAFSFKRKRMKLLAKKDNISQVKVLNYYQGLRRILRGNLRYIIELSHQDLFHTIKYEDLVTASQQTLANFLKRIDLPFEDTMLNYHDYTHHIVEGNHMRLQKKPIYVDRDYLTQLSPFEWAFGTFRTLPLIIKYNYPLSRGSV